MTEVAPARSHAHKAPGWKFYLAVSVPTLFYLWAASYPGYSLELRLVGLVGVAIAAITWVIAYVPAARRESSSRLSASRFAVALVGGLLLLGFVSMDAPLRTRWALSKGAFEKRLAAAQADPEYRDFSSRRLGAYKVVTIERNHDAIVFQEAVGSFFDNAGFAYLPDGPKPVYSNGGFESPSWKHLGGHWYAWTASW